MQIQTLRINLKAIINEYQQKNLLMIKKVIMYTENIYNRLLKIWK